VDHSSSPQKTSKEHRVALSDAALSILAAIPRSGKTATRPFPIGGSAMLELVKRHMGRDVTPHGFRATFSTWVTEQTDTPTEIRELALAHVSGDKVAAAYQRSVLLEKRRTLMERWGRFCGGGEGKSVALRPAHRLTYRGSLENLWRRPFRYRPIPVSPP